MIHSARWHVAAALFVLATLFMNAGDPGWPHPRGSAQDGRTAWTGLALPLPKAGPVGLWKRGLGPGYSGMVVAGQRAFTQTQSRAGQSVVCLDLTTGELLWQTVYAPPQDPNTVYPGPYATPTVTVDRVFFSGADGVVGCLHAKTGKLIWQRNLRESEQIYIAGFGYAATPLIHEDTVYYAAGGEGTAMIALNAADGSKRWCTGTARPAYGSAVQIVVDGQDQIVAFYEDTALAFDPKTGEVLWRDDIDTTYHPQAVWPVYDPPYLFRAMTFRRGARVLALHNAPEQAPATLVWANNSLTNDIVSSVAHDGFVYGFDIHEDQSAITGHTKGVFKCVELASGKERWQTDKTGQASVLVCGDKLLLVNEQGTLIIAEASPEEYRELARSQLFVGDRLCWAPPAVADGYLLVRSGTHVGCFHLGDADSLSNRPGSMSRLQQWLTRLRDAWVQRHRSEAFGEPNLRALAFWFAVGGLFVVSAMALMSLPISRRWKYVGIGLVMIAGLLAMPLLTVWLDRFVFTWPAVWFLVYLLLVWQWTHAADQKDNRLRWLARGTMVFFVMMVAAFGWLCQSLQISVGWGFFVGLPLAWLPTRMAARSTSTRTRFALAFLAFTVFYWTSAVFILWKTG